MVWKAWMEGLKRKALWFEGEVSNAIQGGRGMKKELSKVLQGTKEYQVKNEVLNSRRVAERETARSIQKELERAKCKLEGNVTRLAMENARQVKAGSVCVCVCVCVCAMIVVTCMKVHLYYVMPPLPNTFHNRLCNYKNNSAPMRSSR